MKYIKWHRQIEEMQDPVMLAGWPGMGNVALNAVEYIRKKLNGTLFAEIDLSSFWIPEEVIVENGFAKLPSMPKCQFYYVARPSLVIMEGDAQFSREAGIRITKDVLDLADKFKIKKIFTGAAFPFPMAHREKSVIYGVANMKKTVNLLSGHKLKFMENGQISGLNGILIGYAKEREIEGICLLATISIYATGMNNPKASKAIAEILQKILDFKIDMSEMELAVKNSNKEMDMIEKSMEGLIPQMQEEKDNIKINKEKVPAHILDKIEKLFTEASNNREKAQILKEELDRWDLYNLYEDSFLEIFRQSH